MDIERINRGLERGLGRTLLAPMYRGFVRRMDIERQDAVLDFGCGTGNTARHIAKKAGALVCLDIDTVKLGIAQKALRRYDNVTFADTRIEDAGLDGTFSKIVAFYVLHDFSEALLRRTADAFLTALQPGGHVYVCEPKKPSHGIAPVLVSSCFESAGFTLIRDEQKRSSFFMVFERV